MQVSNRVRTHRVRSQPFGSYPTFWVRTFVSVGSEISCYPFTHNSLHQRYYLVINFVLCNSYLSTMTVFINSNKWDGHQTTSVPPKLRKRYMLTIVFVSSKGTQCSPPIIYSTLSSIASHSLLKNWKKIITRSLFWTTVTHRDDGHNALIIDVYREPTRTDRYIFGFLLPPWQTTQDRAGTAETL